MANIIDRSDYKLKVTLNEFRPNEYHLEIAKFVPELEWKVESFFLTKDEFKRLQKAIIGE
jgi:hypothetical protein